jgi:hypothetical protein
MAEEEKICGECMYFYPIQIPTGTGSQRETDQAHCLAKSVYAKNKPGNPVFPPGAKTADLQFAQHQIVIVRRKQHSPNCMDYKKKGGPK